MPVPQVRQRPRRSSQERTGTLSYHAICVPQDMQAERPVATERRSGTRATTTFRNEPRASAGKNESPAAAKLIESGIGTGGPKDEPSAAGSRRSLDSPAVP